ncbi:hypothetical protein AB1L42_08870 [Thalassoglobus sp. JC818]|uniref:hypothetical protein n=1 Tax=Thalassoglobus sp. JC818 TaxID=3232136 RepID=UPI003459AC2A
MSKRCNSHNVGIATILSFLLFEGSINTFADGPPDPLGDLSNPGESRVQEATIIDHRISSSSNVTPAILELVAYSGEPLSVGRIHLKLADITELRNDRIAVLTKSHERPILYFTSKVEKASPETQSEAEVIFLFKGKEPFSVTLTGFGDPIEIRVSRVIDDQRAHRDLLKKWWFYFTNDDVLTVAEELETVRDYFLDMLARRMQLERPNRRRRRRSTDLERQFERSVEMLFGFESVRLAMMTDEEVKQSRQPEEAIYPLPRPIQIASVTTPFLGSNFQVEPIASAVPPECFYLRCGRIQNYLWVRDLLMGWGGGMSDIVAVKNVDPELRSRYERQLCFSPRQIVEKGIDEVISDCALIGTDLEFENGAGLGILFESDHEDDVSRILGIGWHETKNQLGLKQTSEQYQGRNIWKVSTPDNRIRCLYTSRGKYSLLTNCQHLAHRFLDTAESGRGLGGLPEYQYACSQVPKNRNKVASIYLSDPFFRSVTTPAYRIENARRKLARRDLEQLTLARFVASAESHADQSLEGLVRSRFLPSFFLDRADGSTSLLLDDGVVDSLRGGIGTFLPIADVPVNSVTKEELNSYQQFTAAYSRQWRRVDPVIVTISAEEPPAEGQNRVLLDIGVTPYARQEYAFLTRYLGEEHRTQTVKKSDLLSLSATLKNFPEPYNVRLGIQDDEVPFRIRDGVVEPMGRFEGSSFGRQNSYAAIRPGGLQGLKLLEQFASNFQNEIAPKNFIRILVKHIAKAVRVSQFVFATPTQRLVLLFQSMASSDRARQLANIDRKEIEAGNWSVYGQSAAVRDQVFNELALESTSRSAQVFFALDDVRSSQVFPYLRTSRYYQCKQDSDATIQFLNRTSMWLNVSVQRVRDTLEKSIGGKVVCAAGGTIQQLQSEAGLVVLTSTMTKLNGDDPEIVVPEAYRFEFLEWLRRLEVEFTLKAEKLHARVQVDYSSPDQHDTLHVLVP